MRNTNRMTGADLVKTHKILMEKLAGVSRAEADELLAGVHIEDLHRISGLSLDTLNFVYIDGKCTGLRLRQGSTGTELRTPFDACAKQAEVIHKLPHKTYSSAHPRPDSRNPGKLQLEADIRALIPSIPKIVFNEFVY